MVTPGRAVIIFATAKIMAAERDESIILFENQSKHGIG
jgi:hypothetical protein